jgi:hypothetical protein
VIDAIEIDTDDNASGSESHSKKIISLNKGALGNNDDVADDVADGVADDVADDDADDSSASSDDDVTAETVPEFELKIGYKSNNDASGAKAMHLNYGNMSVSALRQLAKERGVGGEDSDLQKLKKKDLVQLLQ